MELKFGIISISLFFLFFFFLIITLKLFEGENLGSRLSLFNIRVSGDFFVGMDLIQQEVNNLCLEYVAMVWIDLEQGLDQVKCLLSHPCGVDLPQHVKEVVTVNDTLVDLLIILLELGEHLVDLLSQTFLQTFNSHGIDDGE